MIRFYFLPQCTYYLHEIQFYQLPFFTFQAISYVIDVYRGDAKAEKSPFYVGLYISFFPALVAGPIVRYTDIVGQMRNRRMTWQTFTEGCARFIIGVGKKTLLASSTSMVADRIFEIYDLLFPISRLTTWSGTPFFEISSRILSRTADCVLSRFFIAAPLSRTCANRIEPL